MHAETDLVEEVRETAKATFGAATTKNDGFLTITKTLIS